MNLFVAIGMDQDTVLCAVCTPQRFIHDVVVMPSCYVRHWLVTDRAEAALFFPEVHQPTPSAQGLFHLHAEAFLHIAPYGRTLQPSPLAQGPARGAVEAYVPRLITSPSS
jgi:hypothetical protein